MHYVITEYGIAYLFGKSIRQRATALGDVAAFAAEEDALLRLHDRGRVVCCVDDAIAVYREATAAAGTSRGGTAFADPGEWTAPEG